MILPRLVVSSVLMLWLVACETVPITGRSQIMLLPEGNELAMGIDAYRDVLQKSRVSSDAAANAQAAVLGHEVAHAIARHGGERVSHTLLVQTGLAATQAALSRGEPSTVQAVTSLLGAGAAVGVLLPWGRAQESEADHLGLVYMAKAGYAPRAARDLWLRMDETSKGSLRPPEFLSTHPLPETRIRQIEGWLPEALTHYRPR